MTSHRMVQTKKYQCGYHLGLITIKCNELKHRGIYSWALKGISVYQYWVFLRGVLLCVTSLKCNLELAKKSSILYFLNGPSEEWKRCFKLYLGAVTSTSLYSKFRIVNFRYHSKFFGNLICSQHWYGIDVCSFANLFTSGRGMDGRETGAAVRCQFLPPSIFSAVHECHRPLHQSLCDWNTERRLQFQQIRTFLTWEKQN